MSLCSGNEAGPEGPFLCWWWPVLIEQHKWLLQRCRGQNTRVVASQFSHHILQNSSIAHALHPFALRVKLKSCVQPAHRRLLFLKSSSKSYWPSIFFMILVSTLSQKSTIFNLSSLRVDDFNLICHTMICQKENVFISWEELVSSFSPQTTVTAWSFFSRGERQC